MVSIAVGALFPVIVGSKLAEGQKAILVSGVFAAATAIVALPIWLRFSAPSKLVFRSQSSDRARDTIATVALGIGGGAVVAILILLTEMLPP